MNELLNLENVENNTKDIAQQILDTDDQDKVKDLTQLFNLNQAKKNVLRVLKLNELLDKISDQMMLRFEHRADEFSNVDLLNYMNTVQTAIEKANKSLSLVSDMPLISVNNTTVNVEVGGNVLTRESRNRITEVVQLLLNKAKDAGVITDEDIIDTTSNEIKETDTNDTVQQ